MPETLTPDKETYATPWVLTAQRHVCQRIADRLPVYRAAGWPVETMDAEIQYLPHSRLALWRLVSPRVAGEVAP
jgi:hypothetical protein